MEYQADRGYEEISAADYARCYAQLVCRPGARLAMCHVDALSGRLCLWSAITLEQLESIAPATFNLPNSLLKLHTLLGSMLHEQPGHHLLRKLAGARFPAARCGHRTPRTAGAPWPLVRACLLLVCPWACWCDALVTLVLLATRTQATRASHSGMPMAPKASPTYWRSPPVSVPRARTRSSVASLIYTRRSEQRASPTTRASLTSPSNGICLPRRPHRSPTPSLPGPPSPSESRSLPMVRLEQDAGRSVAAEASVAVAEHARPAGEAGRAGGTEHVGGAHEAEVVRSREREVRVHASYIPRIQL